MYLNLKGQDDIAKVLETMMQLVKSYVPCKGVYIQNSRAQYDLPMMCACYIPKGICTTNTKGNSNINKANMMQYKGIAPNTV